MRSRLQAVMVALILALALGGCVRIEIGDSLPTVGEELVDLEQARDLGALTEEEFRRLRRALVERL